MKKLESTLPNMFIVLTLIALISAAALGATYGVTEPILAEQARQRRIQAVSEVVPAFDNQPTDEAITPPDNPSVQLFPARRAGEAVGAAVQISTGAGYGGTIELMVGFGSDGTVTGLSVLRHQETPGLGARITQEGFRSQFVGQAPADELQIDGITAATISSQAVIAAVERAWQILESTGGIR